MKRILAIIMLLCMLTSLIACSNGKTAEEALAENKQAISDFKESLNTQHIVAVNARVVTDENGRRGLMADIENNMVDDIEINDLVIAFSAWDTSGVPLCIKTEKNPDYAGYIIEMAVDGDIAVSKEGSWIADCCIYLSENCDNIAYVEAIAVSGIICGETWENPCYSAWKETYEGVGLAEWQREAITNFNAGNVEVSSDDTDALENDGEESISSLPFSEFYEYLFDQEIVAVNASANLQEDGRNALMADIKNNMVADADEICIAFAIWDENGSPLLIESASGLTEASYVKEANMGSLMVEGGETWVADMGLIVANERSTISHVEAIIVSCKLNGSDWANPMYEMWKYFFGGKTLDGEMLNIINSVYALKMEVE